MERMANQNIIEMAHPNMVHHNSFNEVDQVSEQTLRTNQIFQSRFFYNSQIDVSAADDDVGEEGD